MPGALRKQQGEEDSRAKYKPKKMKGRDQENLSPKEEEGGKRIRGMHMFRLRVLVA